MWMGAQYILRDWTRMIITPYEGDRVIRMLAAVTDDRLAVFIEDTIIYVVL